MTADEVLQALMEAGVIQATKVESRVPKSKSQFICPSCGYFHIIQDCACHDNKIIEVIRNLEDKEEPQ